MKQTDRLTPPPASAAIGPTRPIRSARASRVKRQLIGAPFATERLVHERLGKPTALAVFASDNLSSSAYATEEILRVLRTPASARWRSPASSRSRSRCWRCSAILLFSYRQTIKAYPQAGGAYLVTRDNFGILPAQVAGVSLLTDYILTVSVSVVRRDRGAHVRVRGRSTRGECRSRSASS